jgi:sugar phosphate isomerase/epimerase
VELACSVRMFGSAQVSESLKKIFRVGFRSVELDWEILCRQLPVENRRVAMVKEMVSDLDLNIAAVNVGNITAERDDQMRLQFLALEKTLEAVNGVGCKLAVIGGGPRTLENFNCVREGVLSTLAAVAGKNGLDLALANENDTRLENRQDFLAMFTAKFPPNIGVCIDVYHCHLAAVNAGDVIREMGPRIKLVRISDMMGTMSVLPGQGEIEIKGLVRTLRKVGYQGPVVVDHLPARDEKMEKVLEEAYAYLQNIIS